MKKPYLNQNNRDWLRLFPDSLHSDSLRFDLAKQKFLRELDKTPLFQLLHKLIEWLSKKLKTIIL